MAYPTTVLFSANMTGAIGNVAGTTPTGMVAIYDADPGAGVVKRVKPSQSVADATIDGLSGIFQGMYFISPGNALAGVDDVTNGGAGTAGEIYHSENSFFFRRQTVGGSDHYIKVTFSIQDGTVHIYTTRASGTYIPADRLTNQYLTSSYPPTFNIVDANRHECRCWIEDDAAFGTVRLTVTDLTALVVRQNITLALTSADSQTGSMGFYSQPLLRHFEYVEFAEVPILVGPPTQTIAKTSTSTTTTFTVTPAGGNGTKTVSVKLADGVTHVPGSPQTYVATPLVFSRSGLTPAYHYVHYVTTTDSTPGTPQSVTEGVNIFTRQAGIPTAIRIVGVGDSITIGPTTTNRPTYIARDIIAEMLSVSGTAAQEATVATGGYSSGQIAALAAVVVDAVNGVANADSSLTGASLPLAAPADLVVIRLGKNDTGTAAETAANIQTVIDAVRAGCTHNPWIMLLPITGYDGTGAEGLMSADRQYQVYDLLAAKEDVANRIVISPRLSWWMFVWNPAYLPDHVHPLAAQIDILAQEIAWTYALKILPASVPGSFSVGSGSGGGGGMRSVGIGF